MESIPTNIWRQAIAPYQQPILSHSVWQVINSFGPYLILWVLLIWSINHAHYWLALPFYALAIGFLVRIFIIFHDCGHGSFFKSRRAASTIGFFAGVLTFSPYEQWRRNHAIHHATAGDLDRRGTGDVYTMTVDEFLAAPPLKRLGYRLLRNPIIIFGFGPLFLFFISPRFPKKDDGRKEKLSVLWTNVALLVIMVSSAFTIGLKTYLLIQVPIMWISGSIGIWLFYVQHQFPGVYWARHKDWNYFLSAVRGASFYKLPRLLQWFTGNIGFHHIHHLGPRIPNYLLESCHNQIEFFQQATQVTLWQSLRFISLKLWDEKKQQLVNFSALKKLQRNPAS